MEWMRPTYIALRGFPDSSAGKESACSAGDPSSIPGLGRSAGEGNGYLLRYSGIIKTKNDSYEKSSCIIH